MSGEEQTPSIPAELPLFAYGTLKTGFKNHEHYCRGAKLSAHGRAWGRLYRLHPNVPTLEVPEATVLLRGSADYAKDLDALQELAEDPPPFDWSSYRAGRGWRLIEGELLTFPDPMERIGILDAVEGFHPRTPEYYERILIPLQTGAADRPLGWTFAWTYALPAGEEPPGKVLSMNEWKSS